jgi:hypothetical protein
MSAVQHGGVATAFEHPRAAPPPRQGRRVTVMLELLAVAMLAACALGAGSGSLVESSARATSGHAGLSAPRTGAGTQGGRYADAPGLVTGTPTGQRGSDGASGGRAGSPSTASSGTLRAALTATLLALVVVAVVATVLLAARRRRRRRRAQHSDARLPARPAARRAGRAWSPAPASQPAAAPAAPPSEQDLEPREAVVACWQRFESTLAGLGAARLASETPAELAGRIAGQYELEGATLARLLGAYQCARFSPDEVTTTLLDDARRALEGVNGQLAGLAAGGSSALSGSGDPG